MKGTADRGWELRSDRDAVERLRTSEKDRAENAMIVDMVRNDLWRPCSGYSMLERHLDRLAGAGEYFSRPVAVAELRDLLRRRAEAFGGRASKFGVAL